MSNKVIWIHVGLVALIVGAVALSIGHPHVCGKMSRFGNQYSHTMAYALSLKPGTSGTWFPGSEYGGT